MNQTATAPPMLKIAYLTAGAAGMICGNCLHDNTLARALSELGHDVHLIPLYTPIRTDEVDVSEHRVFYGGINVYLQQKFPLLARLPRWLDRWLDQPWLLQWASGGSIKIDPHQVADLALSVLRGEHGNQRKEGERLADWLADEIKPDVVVFSNVLIAGCIPEIKRRIDAPIVVTLQGDDVFLRELPQPHHDLALKEISRLAHEIDGFLTNSRFYAEAMAEYLRLDRNKIHIAPLGIDTRDFESIDKSAQEGAGPPTIGYLARLAPEKGLHVLADAFIRLRAMKGTEAARLRIAGWLGEKNRPYVEQVLSSLRSAGLSDAFDFLGEVDRRQKLEFLASIDVLSVPTTYKDPKGLFVLEALAAGVPVVQPEHGAFPELLADIQGGLLHRPDDSQHLAERLHELLTNDELHQSLASAGRRNVHAKRNAEAMALRVLEALRSMSGRSSGRLMDRLSTSAAD